MLYHPEVLNDCHPDLVSLFQKVGRYRDCVALAGARSVADEQAAIAAGTSHLTNPLDSKHVIDGVHRLVADAADVAPYPVDWTKPERFVLFAGYVYAVADEMGVNLRWGGDWPGNERACSLNKPGQLQDLDHFERR